MISVEALTVGWVVEISKGESIKTSCENDSEFLWLLISSDVVNPELIAPAKVFWLQNLAFAVSSTSEGFSSTLFAKVRNGASSGVEIDSKADATSLSGLGRGSRRGSEIELCLWVTGTLLAVKLEMVVMAGCEVTAYSDER